MECAVRRILPQEGKVLREIRLRALADSPQAFCSTLEREEHHPASLWQDRARQQSAGNEACTNLALDGDKCVGLVSAFREKDAPTRAEMVSLWVDPKYRRTQLATLLVDAVISWARNCSFEAVTLWVIRVNESAASFYKRLGFNAVGGYQSLPHDARVEGLHMTYPLKRIDGDG